MPTFIQTAHCPRCDRSFQGTADTALGAVAAANNMVREHLKRAQGADLDDGLHDNIVDLWDSTEDPK